MFWWVILGYYAFGLGKDDFFPRPGQVVKHYRERKMDHKGKAWTQKDLAKALGITEQAVRDLENRDVGMDFERRQFLCRALDIPPILLGIVSAEEIRLMVEKYQKANDAVPVISTPLHTGRKLIIDPMEYGDQLASYWQAYYKHSIDPSMADAFVSLDALYRELPHAKDGQEQIQLLLFGYHQFLSRFLFVQQLYADAIEHLNKALFFAEILNNEELLALTYKRRAWMLSYIDIDQIGKAIEDCEKAKKYKNLPYNLKSSILIEAGEVEARAAGSNKDKREAAIALIDQGGNIIRDSHVEADPHFLKVHLDDYHRHKSSALIVSGRNRDAINELKLIKSGELPHIQIVTTILEAQAYLNCGKYARAASLAEYALEIALDKIDIARITKIFQQLQQSPYKDSPDVARLDFMLSTPPSE